jgi:D-beta-D-heptose 7-phosphate kinase/D-beta-D-heptose 1-phosphate adenosyltransferase
MKTIGRYFQEGELSICIGRFADSRVFVIGDIIMDEYLWGDVTRISPEAPVPVVDVKRETKMLGGAANVVHNLASLGAKPVLCGVIGDDHTGRGIIDEIKKMGLSSEGILIDKERPTSIKTRVVAQNQQVVRYDREIRRDISTENIKKLISFIKTNLERMDAIVVSDYGKGVISGDLMTALRSAVRYEGEKSTVIAVDPKTGNFEYYHGVDVITPNHHEAGLFCRFEINDEESLVRAGEMMLSKLECRSVLITQGKEGMTLFEAEGDIIHIPTVAKKVFDVTGAGDTVIGTFVLGLSAGLDFRSAAVLSNFAAGIVVGEVGTSTVTAEELKTTIMRQQLL